LWDLTAPDRRFEPLGHPDVVYAVRFDPRGDTLATAGADGAIRLWGVRNPERPSESAKLTGHADRVYALDFGPDGHTLASGAQDRTARIWDTDPESVAERICESAAAPIAEQTWSRFFAGMPYRPPC
jgi:WD40 repeat protein